MATVKLRSISLRNFRSIGDEDGTGIEIPLGRINYLIGPNGAGKSNVLAGLKNVAAILAGGEYKPKKADYFDNDVGRTMELGATVELSKQERLRLLNLSGNKSNAVIHGELPHWPIFHLVKHSVAFVNSEKQGERISTTVKDESFHTLSEAYRKGDKCVVGLRGLKGIDLRNMSLPELSSGTHRGILTTSQIIELVDLSLLETIKVHFSGLRDLGIARNIADTVPAREAAGLSPDGSNLPTELAGLGREEQSGFDEYMRQITHGDPESVEPRMRESNFVLETKEAGLEHRRTHADLGSGQEQSLILGWQLRNPPITLFMIREPELHLHPERQRQIRRQIQLAASRLQFVIETHSPVFLGTGEGENVLLATKSEGRTRVAKIAPENMRLIREELGISHADALYNTRVVFVEGESEFAAFPVFWKALHPDLGPAPSFFSLGGAGNTKHLRLMLEYLKADDRRFFAILDRHDDALDHAKKLQPDLLPDDNLHILEESFEDEFTSEQVAHAASKLAKQDGFDLQITPEELSAARRESGMIQAVRERWRKSAGAPLNKAKLAAMLAHSCKRDKIPAGIRAALEAAAASLGSGSNARQKEAHPAGDGMTGG